jgi:uncharacterized protein (DUF58 family)
VRTDLRSGASARARALLLVTTGALLVGLVEGSRPLLVLAVMAATPLVVSNRSADPQSVEVRCAPPPGVVVEGDSLEAVITLELDKPVEQLRASLVAPSGLQPASQTISVHGTDRLTWSARLTPERWGPLRPPVIYVEAVSSGGLRTALAELRLPLQLVAVPRPAPVGPLRTAFTGRARTGNHAAREAGDGVEFAGIRPFAPGDTPRRIHWPSSSRRGALYVTERAAESAVDVVLVVDSLIEAGPPGQSTLDLSLRGAAGLARELLATADRVGLVVLGGVMGWLTPATSTRQWYRIATTALGAAPHESYVTPDLSRIPPAALPSGALVVAFTPLLDPRTLTVLADLRRRRFQVVVVDVLGEAPAGDRHRPVEQLGKRLWTLQRAATHAHVTALGCLLAPWSGQEPLAVPLNGALRGAERLEAHSRHGGAR